MIRNWLVQEGLYAIVKISAFMDAMSHRSQRGHAKVHERQWPPGPGEPRQQGAYIRMTILISNWSLQRKKYMYSR